MADELSTTGPRHRAGYLGGVESAAPDSPSEGLFRLVLDALPVGVTLMDRSGDIVVSNPASRRIWAGAVRAGPRRYAASKAWWVDTGKMLAPEEWASARALSRGEISVNEVLEIEAFDGVRKTMRNSAAPIRDATGSIRGAIVVNEDISTGETAMCARRDSSDQMRTLAVLSPAVARLVSDGHFRRKSSAGDDPAIVPLTPRERAVLQLIAEGQNTKEAASTLCISVKTIETHRSNIMKKLRLRSVSDMVRYAIRNRIVEP
jgi:DNA-binding CsgD family transcriptional regulator